MTLIGNLIRKVQSKESLSSKKYSSPPPELDDETIEKRVFSKKKIKQPKYRYGHVVSKVDSSPPRLVPGYMFRKLGQWYHCFNLMQSHNAELLALIKRHHFSRGKVDCRWTQYPPKSVLYFDRRRSFLQYVEKGNKQVYKRILDAKPKVASAKSLASDWTVNRRKMIQMATLPFILFPPDPREHIEDVFVAPPGVKRPRIQLSLSVEGLTSLGALTIELFTDVCPSTCALFSELLAGDGLGHCYVGTSFFRKVPRLYWSGGDVIYDNGFGCYAQRGRVAPIGAENYHFPHSMPGLVSMRVTADDEMCGIFNITFKALPQFDLKNVVFGRVVRPSRTYNIISTFGQPLSSHPVVRLTAAGCGCSPNKPPTTNRRSRRTQQHH